MTGDNVKNVGAFHEGAGYIEQKTKLQSPTRQRVPAGTIGLRAHYARSLLALALILTGVASEHAAASSKVVETAVSIPLAVGYADWRLLPPSSQSPEICSASDEGEDHEMPCTSNAHRDPAMGISSSPSTEKFLQHKLWGWGKPRLRRAWARKIYMASHHSSEFQKRKGNESTMELSPNYQVRSLLSRCKPCSANCSKKIPFPRGKSCPIVIAELYENKPHCFQMCNRVNCDQRKHLTFICLPS